MIETGPRAEGVGVVNRVPHRSPSRNRARLRSLPRVPLRNRSRSRALRHNPRLALPRNRNPSPSRAQPRSLRRDPLRNHNRNRAPCRSRRHVRSNPPSRRFSRSPVPDPRTRSMRGLRPVSPGWGVLREDSRAIAPVRATWAA